MSWKIVNDFEKEIAKFFGSPYAVATDCCTHAIELCLRLHNPKNKIGCPRRTYLSVPMTFIKLGLDWDFEDNNWYRYYTIKNTNIIDAATLWEEKSFMSNNLMCLSFQHQKPLNLGRGGMILCDDYKTYTKLKRLSYDGRNILSDIPWTEQNISSVGYHYYMTPETAEKGLKKMQSKINVKNWSYENYPDLSQMKVFR